jgi:hypothetical protein
MMMLLPLEDHQRRLLEYRGMGPEEGGANGVFFRQILNEDLSCASYVIADGGEAAVVDPKWEIEDYLRIAEGNNTRISQILEAGAPSS